MSNCQKGARYGVVTTWNDGCTERIGTHIEERSDGIYMLADDYDRDIKALREDRDRSDNEARALRIELSALKNNEAWMGREDVSSLRAENTELKREISELKERWVNTVGECHG